MSNRIEDLSSTAQALFAKFKVVLDAGEVSFVVVSTLRTLAEQKALYAQGRQTLGDVNALRVAAGLPLISPDDNTIVTQCDGVSISDGGTGLSNHQSGNAFDLTFADENGNGVWPSDPVRWKALGAMGKSVGLNWGGNFTPLDANGLGWDVDHFEVPDHA